MSLKNNKVALKDLLKLAESKESKRPHSEKPLSNDDILAFIYAHGLDSGSNDVRARSLYTLYQRYSKLPVSFINFSIQMREYFVFVKRSKEIYVKLNKSGLDLIAPLHEKDAKRAKRTKVFQHQGFNKYIKDTNIKEGQDWIEAHVLYTMYLDWQEDKAGMQMSFIVFMRLMDLYFLNRDLAFKGKLYRINLLSIPYLTPRRLGALRRHYTTYIKQKAAREKSNKEQRKKNYHIAKEKK